MKEENKNFVKSLKTGIKPLPVSISLAYGHLIASCVPIFMFSLLFLVFIVFSPNKALSESCYISGYKEAGGEAFVYQGGTVIYRSGSDSSTGWSASLELTPGTYTLDICLVDPAGNEHWYQESRTIAAPVEAKQEKKEETANQPSQQNNTSYTKNQPVKKNSTEYTKTEEQTTQTKITTTNTSTSNKVKAVKKGKVKKKSNKLLSLPFWAIWGFLAFSICGTSLYFGYRHKGAKNAK